ncbi:S-layer homology domain-containing protein [Cohnella pontilimi]|uniref:S-layer homology domain-containing protein n=1 Tax=Cohnella pontilimi TaxID=2564100 RepID=A0A4U0FGZ6_9BACL|nr:S-layer homology domain-containing protein [Cohnella pontilimi]TJY44283.1 S-layer homology domain-containing protein [Cohnella pontilimi]
METNASFKRTAMVIALAAFVWTGTTWSASGVSAAAPVFSDVKGHWAEKDMVKLALQNIIKGNEGKFRPNDSIRREDAVIVALKFMGLADNISVGGSIAFPSSFQVDDYAKPYIVEAFKQKILLADEEYALANQEKGKPWGKTNASREWVARLLVRAIGKESAAADNAGKATAFSDNAKMEANLRPYVLTAVEQGLVSGVTPTTFEPKSPITRAAIAKLFSKAESKINVAYSGQVYGTLLTSDSGKLSLLLDNGTIVDYTISASAMITRFDSDKAVPAATLKPYSKTMLIKAEDGSVGYVEQLDNQTYVTTLEGTFSKLTATTSSVWLSVDDGFKDYKYDKNYEPVVTDAQGKKIALADIPADAQVTLIVDKVRAEPKILAISVKQSVVNKNGSGIVTAWNPASGSLEVADTSTSETTKLTVSPTATFKQGDVFVKADQLKTGDMISYEVKSGVVVSVQMAKPAQTTVTGTFDSYVKDRDTILFTVNGSLSAKFLASGAAVRITGMQDATVADLQKGDTVTLTLDSADKVSQITVTGRNVETMMGATVAGYVAGTKTLSLIDASGKPRNLILVPNVRYDLNGQSLSAETALPLITVPGKKLMVSFSGENAVYVSIVAKYTGTVLENNTTAKTLKLQVGANTVTLPYTYPVVEIYGQTSSSYTQVNVGDQVSALLNGSQDQASAIQVHKRAQFEVVSVDAAALKLRAQKTGTSVVEEWVLPSNVVLQDENGTAKPLSQFSAGMLVNISFQGKTPSVIKNARLAFGKVVSVNASASTINIELSNGTTVTKSVGGSPVIVRDNVSLGSLSVIQPEDRVEIRQDENDRIFVEVIPVLRKYFWKYSAGSQSIDVKRSTLDENYTYALHAQAYIHQGAALLNPTDLKDDDVISLYILRGKVVEIAK